MRNDGKRNNTVDKDKKKKQQRVKKNHPSKISGADMNICYNASCRLRKAGCRGFEGCPGYTSK